MKPSRIPEALPADGAGLSEVLPPSGDGTPMPRRRRPRGGVRIWRLLRAFVGWCWRLLVGSLCCFNFLGSILVVGWSYRWMQGLVIRGWWKKSRLAGEGTFADFCDSLGPDAPVAQPRWLFQERIRAHATRPGPDGKPPHSMRRLFRAFRIPWHSLWLNFKIGAQGLFCTYLLTGWGCLLMLFGWGYGWLNSFSKGYEEAATGPLISLIGIVLFIAAMFYVPMAQVHQAVTGKPRAFFEFRFIWKLIRARLSAYVALAALTALGSLVLEALKVAPSFFYADNGPLYDATPGEAFHYLQNYLVICCFVLFPILLILRLFAAVIYRSAVLKVLRRGWVTRQELNPVLADWFSRLDLYPAEAPAHGPIQRMARAGGGLAYRWPLYGFLALLWFFFAAMGYVSEFLNYHPVEIFNTADYRPVEFSNYPPVVGFVSHPLVQFPYFHFIPQHLENAAKQ